HLPERVRKPPEPAQRSEQGSPRRLLASSHRHRQTQPPQQQPTRTLRKHATPHGLYAPRTDQPQPRQCHLQTRPTRESHVYRKRKMSPTHGRDTDHPAKDRDRQERTKKQTLNKK